MMIGMMSVVVMGDREVHKISSAKTFIAKLTTSCQEQFTQVSIHPGWVEQRLAS
jgi:hypothetical protein